MANWYTVAPTSVPKRRVPDDLRAANAPGRRSARAQGPLTERDLVLITYGDQVTEAGKPPLRTLAAFLGDRVADLFTFVHILPFFPSTSDDGFSVSDYTEVDPRLGDWDDVAALARRFGLMFDLVLNHCSQKNIAFKRFKRDDPRWGDAFLTADPPGGPVCTWRAPGPRPC